MLRRDLILGAASATLAIPLGMGPYSQPSTAWGETSTKENQDDAIDAHVHVWTPDLRKYPLSRRFKQSDMIPTSFTPAELFEHARPQRVSRVVLIQMSFYEFDNRYMLDCIEQHPGVFAGVGIVDDRDTNVVATMKSLATRGVKGFRLYADKAQVMSWRDSQGIQSMWNYGADAGLSMCLLANPDALPSIDDMCQRHPQTPVVIDHFGRIGMDGKIHAKDLDQLCRLARWEKVSVKVSAYYALGNKRPPYTDLAEMIRRLVQEFGVERLMWGSDSPYQVASPHTYADSMALIRERLDFLSDSDRRALLHDTAERIFFRS